MNTCWAYFYFCTRLLRFKMGEASHHCRGFDTSNLSGDLWPMGFDVDLALESPGTRKGHTHGLSSALAGGSLNSLHGHGNVSGSGGYNDIQHLTGLSSILQRSDDLHTENICQMTDLTNSLPKGDSESAQSLLAKLACHDLGPDLTSGVDASHKEIDTALFDQNPNTLTSGTGSDVPNVFSHKNALESAADVYGRMTCSGGKLILQLKHFNLNANYTLNVTECWLCGDKIISGAQLCPHKHSLNGLFQVNNEYVQMEIEHYIIPEHALDPPDGQDMTDNILHQSHNAALHHNMNTPRDLEIPENLGGSGDALVMGSGGVGIESNGTTIHYNPTPDAGLMPPLSVAPTLMGHSMANPNHCINPSFDNLPLPPMSVTSNPANINSSISGMIKNETMSVATQSLCVVSNPGMECNVNTQVIDLPQSETVPSNSMISTPLQRKLPLQGNPMSLIHNYAVDNVLNNFNVEDNISAPQISSPSVLRDLPSENKQGLQYHLPFSEGDYSCQASGSIENMTNKETNDPCLTALNPSVSLSFESQLQRPDVPPKRMDVGSKKRKGRVQRKASVFQDSVNRMGVPIASSSSKSFLDDSSNKKCQDDNGKGNDGEGTSMEYRQMSKSDASFVEDWIRENLPGEDLIVPDNHLKTSTDTIPSKIIPSNTKATNLSPPIEKEPPAKSPRVINNLKSREPDQTSRLAAHMLTRGLDLSCRLCHKDFGKDGKIYKIHMKEHGLEDSEMFACSFCTKTFSKAKHYTQHLQTHIKNRRFSCRLCTASYTREAKLRRHMLTHSQESRSKDFECTKCTKAFTTKYYLQAHLQLHDEKKFKCDTCGISCTSLFNLETHKKKHLSDKPFKCELCEKTFVRRDFLDVHMENVHKNKKLKCELCDKLFSRKYILKRHIASHNNETFECKICSKIYTRKDRLAAHIKTHKSTTTYKCSRCPASFIRKFILEKHEKVHQKKEQCSVCYIFLPSKQRLLNHMKLHSAENTQDKGEGMHKCEICSKSLPSRDVLRKHMRKIHGKAPKIEKKLKPVVEREKRFFCQWCSKGFTRSCNLNSHLLKAHSKDTDEEFEDDLPTVLKTKLEGSNSAKTVNSSSQPPSVTSSSSQTTLTTSTVSTIGMSGGPQSTNLPSVGSFQAVLPSSPSSTPPHPPPALAMTSHFPSSGPPDSPINLSTDAITAAAYLLAYLSYPGPY
ncbi:hypothetical protein SK128_006749 [Halocaridina rubra]|uniref:C2H2-type domain-containing protein n=1 Tax=Halocaridina rubra TaxID=373956 RepID=A0AAN8XPB6_HALRR